VKQKTRFFPKDISKKGFFAKIEVGYFPGSQNFFLGKIDEVISESNFCIHGALVRLENGLIGRIVILMNEEEFNEIQSKKTEMDIFLELLLFQNITYEQKIYDNATEYLSEMNHQSQEFYGESPISDEQKKIIHERIASLEKNLISTHKKLLRKFTITQKEIKGKTAKKMPFDSKGLDKFHEKLSNFERFCRGFIVETLSTDEKWWKQRIPDDIRNNALERKEHHEKSKTTSTSYDLIDFIDFGDITKIILSNKKYFKSIKNLDAFKVKMEDLGRYRNELAHSRELEQIEKYNFNACIYYILQMFQSITTEVVTENNPRGTHMQYKKPIPEQHIPSEFITLGEKPNLEEGFKEMTLIKRDISIVISKDFGDFLINLSNWAKKQQIPIIQLECTSETTYVEFNGRKNYTQGKNDDPIGIELGALKLANELSEIHGSAILLLENIENLSPLHQDGTLLPFMKWGEIPSGQTKDFVSMINHKKLKIIGTQTQLKKGEESSLSPRLGGVCTYPFYEKEI